MQIVLSSAHGLAAAVLSATSFTVFYFGIQVGSYRRKAQIPYPFMYASKQELEQDKDGSKHLFNCAQRVHYNTLEGYPIFLVWYLISAIEYPLIAAISGVIWIFGKILYSRGYMTGKPEKRVQGSFSYIGLLALLITSTMTAYKIYAQ